MPLESTDGERTPNVVPSSITRPVDGSMAVRRPRQRRPRRKASPYESSRAFTSAPSVPATRVSPLELKRTTASGRPSVTRV